MFQLNEFQTPEKIMSFFDPAYKNFFEIVFKQNCVSFLTKFFFSVQDILYLPKIFFFFQFIPLSSPHNYYNELINKKKQQKPEKKDYV